MFFVILLALSSTLAEDRVKFHTHVTCIYQFEEVYGFQVIFDNADKHPITHRYQSSILATIREKDFNVSGTMPPSSEVDGVRFYKIYATIQHNCTPDGRSGHVRKFVTKMCRIGVEGVCHVHLSVHLAPNRIDVENVEWKPKIR